MSASSPKVRSVLALLSELTDEEWLELDSALLSESSQADRAWGEEVDRRAQRALRGEGKGLSRTELAALLRRPPEEARAYLAQVLASRS